jgi:hypothetical protein
MWREAGLVFGRGWPEAVIGIRQIGRIFAFHSGSIANEPVSVVNAAIISLIEFKASAGRASN